MRFTLYMFCFTGTKAKARRFKNTETIASYALLNFQKSNLIGKTVKKSLHHNYVANMFK